MKYTLRYLHILNKYMHIPYSIRHECLDNMNLNIYTLKLTIHVYNLLDVQHLLYKVVSKAAVQMNRFIVNLVEI